MVMESKDILIMNSTIIGGILILLTISSFSENEFPNRSIFVVIAVVVVIIFSISSISILYDKQEQIIKKYSDRIYSIDRIYDLYRNNKYYQYYIARHLEEICYH